jgi:F0F1-type ATP synthase alpha subunit
MKIKDYDANMDEGSDAKNYQNKIFSKFDYDLFDETKNKIERIVRVKRVVSADKREKWRVIEDNKVVFVVDGNRISKMEREFLRTPAGFNFLISAYKNDVKSVVKLKIFLKMAFSNSKMSRSRS